jgi:hypothetical protein
VLATEEASTMGDPTLGSLLGTAGLRLRLVTGDRSALGRPIRWVHSTELAQPGSYLRGGELICTVGVLLADAASCLGFVQSVAAAGAVGICFGSGDVHPSVPPALVQACSEAGLPLLELPAGAPFIALSEHLADRWVRAGSMSTARDERVVGQMLEALSLGMSIQEVLGIAGAATGGRLEVLSGSTPRLGWTGSGEPPSVELLLQMGRVVAVVDRGRDLVHRTERAAVGHLLALVATDVADVRALVPALRAAGLAECSALVVRAMPISAMDYARSMLPSAVLGEVDDVVLVVASASTATVSTAGPQGVSAPVPPQQLGHGVVEARRALVRALRLQAREMGPHDLVNLDALLDHVDDEGLASFVERLIKPLVDADQDHGTSHLRTLRCFLSHAGSLQRTAKEQFLHVNTVRNRLERVHRVTGRNPLVFHDLLLFAVALAASDRAEAERVK